MANAQQIPKLVSVLVEHQGHFAVLSSEDAQWLIKKPKEAIALMSASVKQRSEPNPTKELVFVGSTVLPAAKQNFVARDRFKEGDLGIARVESRFYDWFSPLVENPSYETDLKCYEIPKSTSDIELSYLLGREKKCPVALRHVHMLLETHMQSGTGPLLVDGRWNRFYVKDSEFEIRCVQIGWREAGWDITVQTFGRSYDGFTQGIVFSS